VIAVVMSLRSAAGTGAGDLIFASIRAGAASRGRTKVCGWCCTWR
jgi:hypothetical protein